MKKLFYTKIIRSNLQAFFTLILIISTLVTNGPIPFVIAQEATDSAIQSTPVSPPAPTPSPDLISPTTTPTDTPTPSVSVSPTQIPSSPTPTVLPTISPTVVPIVMPILIMDSPEVMESAKIRQPAKILPLIKRHYLANESITAKVINIKDPNVKAALLYASGEEVSLPMSKEVIGEETVLRISPGSSFKPGKYTLKVIDSNGEESTQDFTWGVLAINTNKSIYLPGEQVYLQMAALKDDGHTLCDANLRLEITTPENKIISPEVQKSGECKGNNVTTKPDYFSYAKVDKIGIYKMVLSNLDNKYQITDSFEVKDSVPFEIERQGPTRIYPFVPYPMHFKIKANIDFEGEIEERIPKSFEVKTKETEEAGEWRVLKQKVKIKAGETFKNDYFFDAPDISPQFYLLGPIRLVDTRSLRSDSGQAGRSVFEEARSWQIAADAAGSQNPTRLWMSGFELQSNTAGMEYTANVGTGVTINLSTFRSGVAALNVNTTTATGAFSYNFQTANDATGTYFRMYVNFTTRPNANTLIMAIRDVAPSNQASIRYDNVNNTLELWDEDGTAVNGTPEQVGEDSAAISAGVWYRIEMYVDFGTASTTDTKLAGRLDGTTFASSTNRNWVNGIMTMQGGVTTTNATANMFIDDVAINADSTTSVANEGYPGEGKIVRPLIDGNGIGNTAWTGGPTDVDEVTPNNGTDYVQATAVGQLENFTFGNSSTVGIGANDTIKVIQVGARIGNSTASAVSHTYSVVAALGVGTSDVATAIALTNAGYLTNNDEASTLNPVTTVDATGNVSTGQVSYDVPGASTDPWTAATLDDLQVRLSSMTDIAPIPRVSAIWAMVEYVPAEGGRLYSTGFELRSTTTNVEYTANVGTPSISTTTYRSGTAALQTNPTTATQGMSYNFESANTQADYYLRAYIYIASAPSATTEVMVFRDSTSDQLSLRMNSSRQLLLWNEEDNAGVGSTSSSIPLSTWTRLEMRINTTTLASTAVEGKIDGTSFASGTVDHANGVMTFQIGVITTSATADFYWDDVAINKNVGSSQNGYPGDGKIVYLRPNADGNNVGWTNPGYTQIYETTPDDATTRISSTTLNAIQEANVTDTSTAGISSLATINVVQVGVRFNNSSTTRSAFKVRLKDASGAASIESFAIDTLVTTWYTNNDLSPNRYPITAYNRPDLSSAWTISSLDSAQIGVRLSVDGGANLIQVSTMWLVVDYTEPSVGANQLSGWGYRKQHVINPSNGVGTNYQVKITAHAGSGADSGADVYLESKARSDFGDVRFTDDSGSTLLDYWLESYDDEPVLDSNPYAKEWEASVYGIMSGYLYWQNSRANETIGHIYKTNLDTGATTTHYTGNNLAAWQGVGVGSTIYAVGQENDGTTLRASLYQITSSGVTAAFRTDTDDCNELVGMDTDGTYIVAGERGPGAATVGSSYPNGGGLWKIPIATATTPATWTRVYEDSSGFEWVSIAYFNSKWYGYLSDYKGSWKVISSSNLTSWSIEKDYVAQTMNQDIRGTLINTGSQLVVLAPVQSSNSYHMLVFNGSSWIDYELSLSLSKHIKGLWNSSQSKIIIFVSETRGFHDVYTVGLDGTSLTRLFTSYQTGGIEHLQSRAASFITDGSGKQYFPVTSATAITSDIRSINLSNLSSASQVNFWVEVADDLSTTSQAIYIYYGKPSATTTSSGDNTFVEFIDGQTDESSKLTLVDLSESGINASLAYDAYDKTHYISPNGDGVGVAITGVSGSNFEIWADISTDSTFNGQMGFIMRYSASGVYYVRDLSATSASAKELDIMKQATPPNVTETSLKALTHTDYHLSGGYFRIKASASGTSLWGDTSHENLSIGATDSSYSTGSWGLWAANAAGTNISVKHLVVRKYISPEPGHGAWGSVTSTVVLTQNYYRWYGNADNIQPGSALTAVENGKLSAVGAGDVLRLRISGQVYGGTYPSGQVFKLQYATDIGGSWADVGAIDSAVIWRGYNNTPADGDPITSTLLTVSDVTETYEEANNSAATPNSIAEGQDGEWDWVIQENVSTACQIYYFRMVKSTGTVLDYYDRYPVLIGKSCSQNSLGTADSFQRKTFYESGNGLSWKFFYDGDSIEGWYSSDSGTNWAEGTNADLAVNTNDFTLWHVPGDTYVYIAYTTSNDIKVRRGTFSSTDINWGSEYTALNGSGASDNYQYPFLTRDSIGYIQATARWNNGTNYYVKTTRSDRGDDVSSWTEKVYDLSNTSNTNTNVYGVSVPLASGDLYSAWIKGTTIEGKKWFDGNSLGDGQTSPSWWDANYGERKKLTVWATDAVSSGYTVKYSSNAMAASIYNNSRSDGNDFRILYWTGSAWSELDRDLTKFTSSNVEVWFKLQAGISASSSDGNYYVYYSYSSATSPPTNKANVYKFFDSFDRADGNLGVGWTTNNGTWGISSNVAKQTSTAIQDRVKARYIGGTEPADSEQLAKVRMDVSLDADARFGLIARVDDVGSTGRGYNFVIYYSSVDGYQARFLDDGVTWGGSTGYTVGLGVWYWMRFRVIGSNLYGKIWTDGSDEPSDWTIEQSGWTGRTGGDTGLNAGGNESTATNARASFEDWRLRDSVANEPTVTTGYWEPSATSIGTGVTDLNNNMSAVTDATANIHLVYIGVGGSAVYREYTTSWQTAITLDGTAGNGYSTISLNTANNDLYAFWTRANIIYYKKGVSPYGSANWDASATSWQATGTNKYVTSNYSGSANIFAEWTEGVGSPYTIKWDKIVIGGPSGPTLDQLLRHGGWFNSSGVKQPFTF